MNVRFFAAGMAMGAAGLAALPAAAEDYFEVLNRISAETRAVEGRCELRASGALLDLTDPATGAYISVRVAEANQAEVNDACARGGTAGLTLKFSPQTDVTSYSVAVGVAAAGSAMSVSDYLGLLTAEAAAITSISGPIVRQGLAEVFLRGEGFSVDLMVSLNTGMPTRDAIGYLNACFEVCEEARFTLQPIEFVNFGGWAVRVATGWSHVKAK